MANELTTADAISNFIAFFALIFSCISICQSRNTEKSTNQREQRRDKDNKLFELEQKLDFILAHNSDEITRYKVESFQKDLQNYCLLYGVSSEKVFRTFSKIYVPLTNDGKDVVLDMSDLMDSSAELITLLK